MRIVASSPDARLVTRQIVCAYRVCYALSPGLYEVSSSKRKLRVSRRNDPS